MIRNIRNSIAIRMFRDKAFLKAIAFLIFYHEKTNSNICKGFTYAKLSSVTGVHPTTIKKRLATLKERGFVKIHNGTLVFKSITSKHGSRNKKILNASLPSLGDAEKALWAILVCILQERKNFIHRAILGARYSRDYKTVKNAKQIIRKYAKDNVFHEYGMSYRTIASRLGISLRSAFDYVRNALKHGYLLVKNHFLKFYKKGVNFYKVPGFTFTTKNYCFKVLANTYIVNGYSMPIYRLVNKTCHSHDSGLS